MAKTATKRAGRSDAISMILAVSILAALMVVAVVGIALVVCLAYDILPW